MRTIQLKTMTRELCHELYRCWTNDASIYTVMKNTRSQHVLEKAGFRFVGEDGTFKYYRIER